MAVVVLVTAVIEQDTGGSSKCQTTQRIQGASLYRYRRLDTHMTMQQAMAFPPHQPHHFQQVNILLKDGKKWTKIK